MEPLTRVIVKDYQSIGEASLSLGKLTVIVGRGNLGKSALLRAIEAALFNETGDSMIRLGAKKSSVTLCFAGDQSVEWIKDGTTARYEVDVAGTPITYTKLAGGVPSELQDMFGVRSIEIDKTFSIRPQVHDQHDPPLLLAESAGKAARALAKLTKLEFVVQAQMASAKDLRKAKQDVTLAARQETELIERIGEFPDFEQLDARMVRAKESLELVDERLNDLAAVEDAFLLLEDAQERLAGGPPPSTAELEALKERLNVLQQVSLTWESFTNVFRSVDEAERERETAEVMLVSANKELNDYLETMDVCPLCGRTNGAHQC